MKYETIKFEIEEHKNRKWVIWVSRDGKRFMLGSGISSEEEALRMIGSMKIERKYYQKKIDPDDGGVYLIVMGVMGFVTLLTGMLMIEVAPTAFMNPEYWAIQEVLRTITPD